MPTSPTPVDIMPETSIIIRTFNEGEFLADLLDGIRRQDYQDHEIIVVDSGSFDGTVEIAKNFAVRLVEVASRDFTFGFSLNRGIAVSEGRFLVLVSAHTTPVDSSWLGTLVEPLRDNKVAMTYGRQLGEERSKFSERQDLRRTFGEQRQVIQPPNFFANNANSAVRRDLWEEHPFDEVLPGLEDAAWAKHWMDHDYQVVYEPAAAIHHIHTETWPQVEHRYFREAVAARKIGLSGPSHVPIEIARQARWFVTDVGIALFKELNPGLIPEIARFRWAKSRGTVRALLDNSEDQVVLDHQGFFFNTDTEAVVVSRPGHAALHKIKLPAMKPGDVIVRVDFAGVSETDLKILNGSLGYFESSESTYPIIPGHEISGTVVRTGPNVKSVNIGDRIVIECIQGCGVCAACDLGEPIRCSERKEMGVLGSNGGYTRHLVVPGAHVHLIPNNLDLHRAVLCGPLAVAVKGQRRLMSILGPGHHHVGIIGAGSLGQLLALLLIWDGHEVSVVNHRAGLREIAQRTLPQSQISDDLSTLLQCDGIATVSGHLETIGSVLASGGLTRTLLMLSLTHEKVYFDPDSLLAKDFSIVSSLGSGPADFRKALEVLPDLPLDEFLRSTFPLEDYAEAWKTEEEGETLKVILDVSGRGGSGSSRP